MQLAYAVASAHAKACAPPPAAAAAPAAATPSTAGAAEKEKAAAAAFGLKAYTNVETLTLDEIEPKYRATGKQVKALRDGWNCGTMVLESYKLNLQQSVLSLDEEKTTALTSDLQLTLNAPPSAVSMTRNAHFLTQLRIFKGKVLAAGMAPVEPSAENPQAGSKGTKARVVTADPAKGPNAEKTVPWHILPGIMTRYENAGTEASSTMVVAQLNAVHEAFHERAAAMIGKQFNYASALDAQIEMHTWHSMLNMLPKLTPLPAAETPRADRTEETEAEKELKELRSERKRLTNELEQARSAKKRKLTDALDAEGGRDTPTRGRICYDFQRNACARGDKCIFAHECEHCGSRKHGAADCPERRNR